MEEKTDLEKKIERQEGEFRAYAKDWQDEFKELYDYRAGNQWSDEDKAILESQMRPCITFNRMGPFIDAVIGLEVQNRQEVRFIPRGIEDNPVNDLLTSASEWVRDLCNAASEESDAFSDLVLGGIGWTNTRVDFDDDPEGRIVVERIDPLSMSWDSYARKRNLADARWVKYDKKMSTEEIMEKWPEAEFLAESPSEDLGEHDASQAWEYKNDTAPESSRQSKVISEYQYFKLEKHYKIATPNGIMEKTASEWSKIKKSETIKRLIEEGKIRELSFNKKTYYRAFLAGGRVLENKRSPSQRGFTFRCMTGKRDRNKNTWFGLGRGLRDPQQWTNKFFSSILHHIVTSGKGIMAEETAFANPQKAEDEWAQPDAIKWMQDGAISQGKVQPTPSSTLPQDLHALMQFSVSSFNDVAGMSIEMLGLTDRQQPGVVEMQRKQAGLAILAWCFDSLKLYRQEQGRILAEFITEYISDGRLVRIVGEQGAQAIPLLKDNLTLDFDVVVDDAPTSPNMKERVMQVLMQFLPALMQFGIPIPPQIIDYMPLPESLAQAWKEMLKPNPQAQKKTEVELAQDMAKAKKDESVVKLNEARTQKTLSEIEVSRQVEPMKAQNEAQKVQNDAAKVQNDAARVQNDSLRAQTGLIQSAQKTLNDAR